MRDCCDCILTNETHRLYIESESPMWIDLSAGWSEVSGFFTAFRMTGGGAAVVCRDYSAAAILSQWNRASPKRAWFTLALLWYRWMSISLVKDIPPWHWCARYVTLP